jgi:hypothetical protein
MRVYARHTQIDRIGAPTAVGKSSESPHRIQARAACHSASRKPEARSIRRATA